jgi:hypothetical protein
MEEPLRRIVSRRAVCTAIDAGLAEWLRQEAATRGKEKPHVALDASAQTVLGHAVEQIRERARDLTVVSVRITNKDIKTLVANTPARVRYRLACRIGGRLTLPRWVETETEAGTRLTAPRSEELGRDTLRISVDVRYWDARYKGVGMVEAEPPYDAIEIPLEDPLPPGYRERLSDAARRFHSVARAVPAIGRLVQRFLADELHVASNRVRDRFFTGRVAPFVLEIVRAGRIELVEVETPFAVGGVASVATEAREVGPSTERIDATPNVGAFIDDMIAHNLQGATEAVREVVDIVDATRTSPEEMAEQSAILDRLGVLGRSAADAIAGFMQEQGMIENSERWIEEESLALVEARRGETLGRAYMAQVERRLGRADAPLSLLWRTVDIIAARDLPASETDPLRAIVVAARSAVELRPQLPVFVPPLDQFADGSLTWIILAARTLDRIRSS